MIERTMTDDTLDRLREQRDRLAAMIEDFASGRMRYGNDRQSQDLTRHVVSSLRRLVADLNALIGCQGEKDRSQPANELRTLN